MFIDFSIMTLFECKFSSMAGLTFLFGYLFALAVVVAVHLPLDVGGFEPLLFVDVDRLKF